MSEVQSTCKTLFKIDLSKTSPEKIGEPATKDFLEHKDILLLEQAYEFFHQNKIEQDFETLIPPKFNEFLTKEIFSCRELGCNDFVLEIIISALTKALDKKTIPPDKVRAVQMLIIKMKKVLNKINKPSLKRRITNYERINTQMAPIAQVKKALVTAITAKADKFCGNIKREKAKKRCYNRYATSSAIKAEMKAKCVGFQYTGLAINAEDPMVLPGETTKKEEPTLLPKVTKKTPPKKEEPSSPVIFDLSARYGLGFGGTLEAEQNPGLLSDRKRGIIDQGEGSVRLMFKKDWALQLDYTSHATYDVPVRSSGKDDVLDNDDYLRLSLSRIHPDDMFSFLIQAGYRYYRNDYPNSKTKDFHGLIVNGRGILQISPSVIANLDANLIAGQTNSVLFGERKDFDLDSMLFKGGFSFKMNAEGSFMVYIGGIGGYDHTTTEGIGGGYAGLGFHYGIHEGNVKLEVSNNKGLDVATRYFLNDELGGFGPQFSYRKGLSNDPTKNLHELEAGLFGRIKLYQIRSFSGALDIFNLPIELELFFNYTHQVDPITANNFHGGVNLRFGRMRAAKLPWSPYSFTPFSEENY